ncbi:MAG: hypothetical protein ACRD0J_08945, partial [Acidimicrobiales bacterium]
MAVTVTHLPDADRDRAAYPDRLSLVGLDRVRWLYPAPPASDGRPAAAGRRGTRRRATGRSPLLALSLRVRRWAWCRRRRLRLVRTVAMT